MTPCLPRLPRPPLWRLSLLALALLGLAACSPPPAEGWSGYVEGEFVYVGAPVAGTLTGSDSGRLLVTETGDGSDGERVASAARSSISDFFLFATGANKA